MTSLVIKQTDIDQYEPILLNGEEIFPSEIKISLSATDTPFVTIRFDLQTLDLQLTNMLLENHEEADLVKRILSLKKELSEVR